MDKVPLAGDGFRLTLRVDGFERPAGGEVWDDNWLRGSVSVEIAQPPLATFGARCDVAFQTTELHAFHEGLRTLLDDLTGSASLTTIEDQVELTIDLKYGKGTLTGRIEAHAVATLGSVAMKYPYRG